MQTYKKILQKQHILEEIPEIEAKILKVSNRQKCNFWKILIRLEKQSIK